MKNSINLRSLLSLITILIIALFSSCKTTQPAVDNKDLAYLYNPTKNPINPGYTVVNQSDETSILSVRFQANELFFSEANPQGVPTSVIVVSVKLFNISQGKLLADTAVINLSILKKTGTPEYVYNIPLKVSKGIDYMAEIKILDRLRLLVVQAFIPFNTKSVHNRYNFKIIDHFEKTLLFDPVVRENEYLNLLYTRDKIDSLYVSYFRPFREVPDPPSMILPEKILDYDPEKIVSIPYSDTMPIMLPREGIYLFSVARDINDGYTLLNFGTDYPTLTSPGVMIEPLAYLASIDDVNKLLSASNPKAALDEFWIKCGGNIDKARELIRIYYTRVQYANLYFTSYKEGWRTERGMIYIIYGPPDKVYKTSEGESWGYRKPVLKSSWGGRYSMKEEYLFFNFKKKENVYSDNDFYLSRSETLVTYWDKAITSWRKGIVFRLDNPEDL